MKVRLNSGINLIVIFFITTGFSLYAQNKSFAVDSLTTLIDGESPPFNQVIPGDTLLLDFGTRDFILIRNIKGDASKPVIITNKGGVVRINTDHYYGISIRNCVNIRLTGTGDSNHFYGFRIERVASGGGIGIGDESSDFEIDHISIENCHGVGIMAKTDPDCSFASTRGNFTQFNSIFHDNYIATVSYEGMYIGSTKYFGQQVHCTDKDTLLLPALLDGVKIYNNIIKYTGWDGIQVSSASNNCHVFDNLILFDSQDEFTYQMSGIMLGGGSKCDCYNNYISQGKGTGIENHGLGGNRIFNNIIIDAGRLYYPLDSTEKKHGIFVSDITMQEDSSVWILHNDIINPRSDGIRFSSLKSRNNLIASNLIINPGNFDYYENGNTSFKGIDSYVMVTDQDIDLSLKNNFLSRTIDSAVVSPTDYSLLPESPLIDAGYTVTKGILFDFYKNPRPYGSAPDIGAFEFNPETLGNPTVVKNTVSQPDIFPNPVRSWLIINFKADQGTEITCRLYTVQGNKIMQQEHTAETVGNQQIRMDVHSLAAGIYIVQLSSQTGSFSCKFIKVN